jgi:hypothetical protein
MGQGEPDTLLQVTQTRTEHALRILKYRNIESLDQGKDSRILVDVNVNESDCLIDDKASSCFGSAFYLLAPVT